MPTFKVGTSARSEASKGFTLMELMVVVGLIALLTVLSMPRISPWLSGDIDSALRRELENLIFATREDAVLTQSKRVIYYDLDNSVYGSGVLDTEGRPKPPEDSHNLRKKLPKGLKFMDVITASKGKEIHTTTYTLVMPNGFIEPTTIHVQDDKGTQYTLFVLPIAGTVRLEEGYLIRQWERS